MRVRQCIYCKQIPSFYQEENSYVISCCDEVVNYSKEEVIKNWNQINKNYYHLFGLLFEINKYREIDINVDSLLVVDEDNKEKIDSGIMMSNLCKRKREYFISNVPLRILQEIGGMALRARSNETSLYIIKHNERMSREYIREIVSSMSVDTLEKHRIRKGDMMNVL